jgi:hypothetical protein
MTEWLARRVGDRILCGRRVDDRYVCQGEIGYVQRDVADKEEVYLPPGLFADNMDAGNAQSVAAEAGRRLGNASQSMNLT